MKIKQLKLANSVRISGSVEEMYLTNDKYDITLKEYMIEIVEKSTGNMVVTTIFNTIWMTYLEQEKDSTGTSKKKSK